MENLWHNMSTMENLWKKLWKKLYGKPLEEHEIIWKTIGKTVEKLWENCGRT